LPLGVAGLGDVFTSTDGSSNNQMGAMVGIRHKF
jgi:predicted porin